MAGAGGMRFMCMPGQCPGMWVCTSGLRWLAMVRAASAYAHVFEVTADYVNISGFNVIGVTGVEKTGIYLSGRQHCNILDNIADSNRVGIGLSSSSNNTLMGNTADSNDYGICLHCLSNNTLYHNNLIDNTNYNTYDDSGTNQ